MYAAWLCVQYVSEAVAAKVVATRRAQVHDRYLKYWAKKVRVSSRAGTQPALRPAGTAGRAHQHG